MDNHGNYAASLGNLCRWLAQQAEAPRRRDLSGLRGIGAAVARPDGSVAGVVAGVFGHRRNGDARSPTSSRAWSSPANTCSSPKACAARSPRRSSRASGLPHGREPQKFGLGMKELWEVQPDPASAGPGHPYDGLAARHSARAAAASCTTSRTTSSPIGFVVHLNYRNPYLYPYMEFQRFKHHPLIAGARRRAPRRLRRARHHRRRLPVGAEARLPGRRAGRLLGGLRQRAAHQGLAQRHEDRDAGGRAGVRGARATGRAGDELEGYRDGVREIVGRRAT